MFELVLFLLSLVMITAAWGFWAPVVAIVGKIALVYLGKPEYSWGFDWGTAISQLAIVLSGIVAVDAIWHQPAYNAAAVVIAVFLFVTEIKS